MDFAELISSLILIASGFLTTYVMAGLRKVSAWIDSLSPSAKRAIVAVLAFVVTQVNGLLGLALPIELLTWTGDVVNTLLIALLSFGFYNIIPKKKVGVVG
jgi:hypothetical protein